MSKKKEPTTNFEASLTELETLVERMESGDLSLEDSLDAFERGVSLTRECQSALQSAQQRVEILTSERVDADPETFDNDP